MCPVKGLSKNRQTQGSLHLMLGRLLKHCFEGSSLDIFSNVQYSKYKEAKTPMWNPFFQIACIFFYRVTGSIA